MGKSAYKSLEKAEKNRLYITSRNYIPRLKVFIFILFLLSGAAAAAILLILGIEFYTIASAGIALILPFMAMRYLFKHVYKTSVKNDNLIHTRADNRTLVTSVKSVGNFKTFRLFGLVFTRYTFNVDKINKRAFLVTRYRSNEKTPKEILEGLREKYKKEKANHKPGSVAAS